MSGDEEPLLPSRHNSSGAGATDLLPSRRNSSGLPDPPSQLSTPQPSGAARHSDQAAWHSAPPAGRGLRRSSSPGLAQHSDGSAAVSALDIDGAEGSGGRDSGSLRRSASGRRLNIVAAKAAKDTGRCGDPTLWGSALIAVAGLALALAWFVTSAVINAPVPPSCIRYTYQSVGHRRILTGIALHHVLRQALLGPLRPHKSPQFICQREPLPSE